jgi:membrane-associated protease RseP (regulator of RpoE activity)
MQLSWRDWFATFFVAAATLAYAIETFGTAVSPHLCAGIILGCGVAASVTAVVYGVGAGLLHANKLYLVLTSMLGVVALVTGCIALASGNQGVLAALFASTLLLWVAATVRHAMNPAGRRAGTRAGQPLVRPT